MWSDMTAFVTAAYSNALDAAASAVAAAASAVAGATSASNAAASAVAAASSAGAALWVSGTTYANGVSTRSPANQRVYIKITAAAGNATDPSANPTDWKLANAEMPTVPVTTATQTIVAGYRYMVTYAGVCALTAPTAPNDQDEFVVIPANGFTNTIDYGPKTLIGPNGYIGSGVMNMDVGTERDIYSTTLGKWVNQ
jgi:hypothetical protein